ncbi:PAS domain S-box-containing protein [Terrimicrobium sacchariphilum]|uniref:histidine kinase n=1 Tax=Terrimicrobium sacchariphilum TaxID=690879 RepID=A0A146G4M1_TERSA|nr:PAS domain S-box protein [Terrimicrobium sacchariphilum]GAT32372.1 PAS domain S-box-containing protein [Terrimicrobium sacchariphilum]
MMQSDVPQLPPRGQVGYLPGVPGWLDVGSDIAIFLAYLVIAGGIVCFLWRQRKLSKPSLWWLIVAFLALSGLTHLAEASLAWYPWQDYATAIEAGAALVSILTVVALYRHRLFLRKIPSLERVEEERTKELADSELRHRLLIESVKDYALIMMDAEGNITSWNSGAERIKGYAAAEILGRNYTIFYPREDVERGVPQHELQRAARLGRVENEGWRVRKDGSLFYASAILTAVRDEEGRLQGFSKVTRDITEKRAAEQRLREQRAFMSRILENLADGVVACNAAGELTFFNRAAREWHGIDAQSMPAGELPRAYGLYQGDGVTPMREEDVPLLRALRGERVREVEMTIKTEGQPERHLVANADAIRDGEDGTLIGAVAVMHDFTRQRQAILAERLTAERLLLATTLGRIGVWDWLIDSPQVAINDEIAEIYGLTGERMIAVEEFATSIHPEDREAAQERLRGMLNREIEEVDHGCRIIRRTDGEVRFIHTIAKAIADGTGRVSRVIGMTFDVTKERERERELSQALETQRDLTRAAQAGERVKSEFLAVMSHEIRTPMNGILGFAEMLKRSAQLSGDERVAVESINSSGRSLQRILNDVLDVSSLGAGQLNIVYGDYSPRELLGQIETLFRPQAEKAGLKFAVQVADDVPELVSGDEVRVRQILLNLIGNALKFTARGGISVSLRRATEAEMEVVVRDSGEGVPKDQSERIFDAFQQSDSSLARRHGGTGLGLSISRSLARLMGGEILMQSEVGRGSSFSLRLPLLESANPAGPEPSTPSLDSGFAAIYPQSILIVEDDAINLRLIKMVLKRLGYEVETAGDGLEAVDFYERRRPDCILMDIQMPRMDGIEATRRIRKHEAEQGVAPAFIVAVTANTVAQDHDEAMQAGVSGYMYKPINLEDLAVHLRQSFEERRRREAD